MKTIFSGIFFVVAVNILLNLWVIKYNTKVPLSNGVFYNHHFYPDTRVEGSSFDLLRSWGQTDSQWYLKIASEGYGPATGLSLNLSQKKMEGLGFAFFPLYPLLIRFCSYFTNGNYELAAFILSNLLLVANWVSIYCVVKKIYTKRLALVCASLIVVFPFSLFLRSYHTEGLYLLALTWWLYFLTQKRMGAASFFLAILNITKGTGWLLNFVYLYYLWKQIKSKHINLYSALTLAFLSVLPIIAWVTAIYFMTGDPLYFYKAVSQWKNPEIPPLAFNVLKLGLLPSYILKGRWIDSFQTIVFIASVILLLKSRKWLKPEWWMTSFLLLIVPTLTTYSVGYTSGRLAVLQLPLWVFFCSRLDKRGTYLFFVLFVTLLFIGSLYFVNWYWWG